MVTDTKFDGLGSKMIAWFDIPNLWLLAWLERPIASTKARSIVLREKYPGLHRSAPNLGVDLCPSALFW